MSAGIDIETRLRTLLKSYDRIGFGRRGVLDAEPEIRRIAADLSPEEHARFCRMILSWIEAPVAEQVSTPLHYNLPEHIQTLAIRLCASLPYPDSLPVLRKLRVEGAFQSVEEKPCREALRETLALLEVAVPARSG